ncbi:hypothetical protein [Pseudomonas fluorescens]|uniref:Uncharacterized protein n=1 Tax=Pseudomonas fluorescens TaxID=294 RepID=A0A5E6Y2K4_PSEFL|nr:hypothetical protein [Pseudomonas fluorescens]VVN47693.1 hypothetical protein PS655_06001 [Pseudomonas fluorescens]
MSVRTELAKLRQQARQLCNDNDVKAISDLIDELSAAAAGGGSARGHDSLTAVFNEAQKSGAGSQL